MIETMADCMARRYGRDGHRFLSSADLRSAAIEYMLVNSRYDGRVDEALYYYVLARHAVLSYIRRFRKRGDGPGRAIALASCVADVPDSVYSPSSSLDLRRALARLSARERYIIQHVYLLDTQASVVAQMLGLSDGRVSQIKSRALRKLKRYMTT